MGRRGTTISRTGNNPWRGFTLIEVVVVAAVITVLLVASVPAFQQTFQSLRAEQAAFEVTQLLRVGRERAVAEGRPMAWVWDGAAHRARVEPAPSDGAGAEDTAASGQIITGARLSPQLAVTLLREQELADRVTFFPDGTSDRAAISLSLGASVYHVDVDAATGQPALSAGTAAR